MAIKALTWRRTKRSTVKFTRDDVLFLRQLPSFLVGAGMGDDPDGAPMRVRELADRIETLLPEAD